MDTPTNSSQVPPAMYLAAAVALLLAGGIIGAYADPYLPSPLSNAKRGYQSGFAAARKVVEDSSFGNFFRTADDVRQLSGVVTAREGDRLTIHTESLNPFDAEPSDRTVTIGASTQVVQLSEKSSAMIQAEAVAFFKAKAQKPATTTVETRSYLETIVGAASVAVGDTVTVTAGENIKGLAAFTAQEVRIQPKTAVR